MAAHAIAFAWRSTRHMLTGFPRRPCLVFSSGGKVDVSRGAVVVHPMTGMVYWWYLACPDIFTRLARDNFWNSEPLRNWPPDRIVILEAIESPSAMQERFFKLIPPLPRSPAIGLCDIARSCYCCIFRTYMSCRSRVGRATCFWPV